MFEIEIAECKGAKEVLKSQLDKIMEHVEECCDSFSDEASKVVTQDINNLKVPIAAFLASFSHLTEGMKQLREQYEEEK